MSFLKRKKKQKEKQSEAADASDTTATQHESATEEENIQNADQILKAMERRKKREKKKQASLLKRRAERNHAKTIQSFLGYERMVEDGVCWVEGNLWSKSIRFSDINYQIARRDYQIDIFASYMELLNYCDTSTSLQVSLINRKVSEEDFKRRVFFDKTGDSFDELREDYNTVLAEKSLESQHHIARERYLTFCCEAESYEKARQKLTRIEEDLTTSFRTMGSQVQSVEGKERLQAVLSCIEPRKELRFEYRDLLESNLSTKDFIAPNVLDFSSKTAYECDDYFGQTLIVEGFPATMSDRFISELSDLPIDLTITLHVASVDQEEALDLVKKKIGFMNQQKVEEQKRNFESGLSSLDIFNFELKYTLDEAEELLDNLQSRNQSMFKVSILINTLATTLDELQDNVFQIKSVGNKNSAKIEELSYLQKEGFNSILPLGRNHVPRERTLTTASTAIFMPFTTQEIYQEGGIYYGQNTLSRNFIYLNRYLLDSFNGFYLGKPGSGKSFASKREMCSVLMSDPLAEVLIIDPEREYTSIAQLFEGEVIEISATSKIHINPFDLPNSDASQTDQIREKSEFILSLCETVMGGKYGLTQSQKSVLDRCVREVYSQYFALPEEERVIPTFKEFYEILHGQPELQNGVIIDHEMRNLERGLEIFCNGSLDVFSNRTNIDIQNRLVVFDVLDLGKQLKSMGMLIIWDQIWNRVLANRKRGVHTWVYIDEFQLLLTNEFSANYFFELWTRSRKYGCMANGITQNVETLLLNDYARRMLSNSDFIMMFNQAASDRRELAELLQISDKQLSYVTNSEAGHGLMFAGNAILPFVDKFPSTSKLYQYMTTKLEEVHRRETAAALDEKVLANQQDIPFSRYEQNEDAELWYPATEGPKTPEHLFAEELFAKTEEPREKETVSVTYRFTSTEAPEDFVELMAEIEEIADPDSYVAGEPYIAGQVPCSADPLWHFVGWFTDEEERQRWRNGTRLQEDLVLFGHWEQDEISTPSNEAVYAEMTLKQPEHPTEQECDQTCQGNAAENETDPTQESNAEESPDAESQSETTELQNLSPEEIRVLKSFMNILGTQG